MTTERAKVNHLVKRGAPLAATRTRSRLRGARPQVMYESMEALERATVVIDCTPAGTTTRSLRKALGPEGYLAQGSEYGFGKPYAIGINEEALIPGEDRFIQIVSCNTHNIATLIKTIASRDGELLLEAGRFVCMRRANDISQDTSFCPAPTAGKHDDPEFGTHHARDASHLFQTLGWKPRIFSSAIKLNSQYMHSLCRHGSTVP